MAQRTGAERFLAPLARVASTGWTPVLVAVVVLGLAGCGGGSDSQTTTNVKDEATVKNLSSSSRRGEKQGESAAEEEQAKAEAKVEGRQQQSQGKQGPAPVTPRGEQESEITPEQEASATTASIFLSSPDLPDSSSAPVLPAAYTCDGENSWPALSWKGVPGEAEELVLFAMNIQPVDERIFFDWAVAGIDPSSDAIEAGELPLGAVVGKNSFGHNDYSICPSKGKPETIMFTLYALPKALSPEQGFDPLSLREEVDRQAGNAGLMAASYAG